MQSEVFNFGSG